MKTNTSTRYSLSTRINLLLATRSNRQIRIMGGLTIALLVMLAGSCAALVTASLMPATLGLAQDAWRMPILFKQHLLELALLCSAGVIACLMNARTTSWAKYLGATAVVLALLACCPFYTPWAVANWYLDYHALPQTQGLWWPAGIIMGMAGALSLLLALSVNLHKAKPQATDNYGSARWANWQEIKKSGLINPQSPNFSVCLGRWQNPKTGNIEYLRSDGPDHIFAYAPTRSGKGVGLVIPTLLTYRGSQLTSDFKLENWQLTAGWRKSIGQTVLKLQPTCTDNTAARYNPLFEIRQGVNEVRDTQNLVQILLDPDGTARKDHWTSTANTLLVGTILHVLYAEPNKSLNGVLTFLTHPDRTKEQILNLMLQTQHDTQGQFNWLSISTGEKTRIHQVVASSAREMLNKSENELSGVFSSATTVLKLYLDPVVAENTSTSDFSIMDLVNRDNPTSLYLGIPPSDAERIMPFMRILLQQTINRLTEEKDFTEGGNVAKDRHPLLFMLDEFPLFGRLAFFEKALAYVAGYGIRFYLIAQDLMQLYASYGRMQTVTSNTAIRVAYAPNEHSTGQFLSEMLGEKTIVQENVSYSGQRNDLSLKNKSISHNETRRALMTADETCQLAFHRSIVMKANQRPIDALKINYREEDMFAVQRQMKAPEKSDRLEVKHPWHNVIIPPKDIPILISTQKSNSEKLSAEPRYETTHVPPPKIKKSESLLSDNTCTRDDILMR